MKHLLLGLFVSLWIGNLNAQRFHDQKIVGYIPSWTSASNVDYSNLTHAMYGFLATNSDGTLIILILIITRTFIHIFFNNADSEI